jgi:hypothetical protein
MLNLLGMNSNTPVKFVLGALLLAIGVITHAVLLIAAGALVLASTLIFRQRARRGGG